jgi:ankyrin repeat protein
MYTQVKRILRLEGNKIDPFTITIEGENCLHTACKIGHFKLVKLFLRMINSKFPSRKSDIVNMITKTRVWTPLHIAIFNLGLDPDPKNNYFEQIALELLKEGAQWEVYDYKGCAPKDFFLTK